MSAASARNVSGGLEGWRSLGVVLSASMETHLGQSCLSWTETIFRLGD